MTSIHFILHLVYFECIQKYTQSRLGEELLTKVNQMFFGFSVEDILAKRVHGCFKWAEEFNSSPQPSNLYPQWCNVR